MPLRAPRRVIRAASRQRSVRYGWVVGNSDIRCCRLILPYTQPRRWSMVTDALRGHGRGINIAYTEKTLVTIGSWLPRHINNMPLIYITYYAAMTREVYYITYG